MVNTAATPRLTRAQSARRRQSRIASAAKTTASTKIGVLPTRRLSAGRASPSILSTGDPGCHHAAPVHALRALTRIERIALAGVVAAFALSGVTRGVNGLLPFFTALIALAGVAWLVSFATELLGEHTGPAVTGFLQSSLGNLPELFVVLFALKAGETEIALTSLIGSVLANALLVLGLAIMVGARNAPDGLMQFRARLPNDTATLLQVAVFGIVLVALVEHTDAAHHITTISAIASG